MKHSLPPTTGQAITSTADALFPKVRQRVLAVLFGSPDRSYYTNELIALAQSGAGAVQRELADLSAVGLLTVRKQGNQRHYQANAASPVFTELRGLILKTIGLSDVLRFVVHKGSTARMGSVDSIKGTSSERFRDQLVTNGVLAPKGDVHEFTRNYLFASPSMAAIAVLGRTANGWLEWKNAQGQTLDEAKRKPLMASNS